MARRVYRRDSSGRFATTSTRVQKTPQPTSKPIGAKPSRTPGRLSGADQAQLRRANEQYRMRQRPGYRRSGEVQPSPGAGRYFSSTPAPVAARLDRQTKADTKRAAQLQKQLAKPGLRPKEVAKIEKSLNLIKVRRMRRTDQKLIDKGQNPKFGQFYYM